MKEAKSNLGITIQTIEENGGVRIKTHVDCKDMKAAKEQCYMIIKTGISMAQALKQHAEK